MKLSVRIGIVFLLLFTSTLVEAQCSMCRAVVENNEANAGQGLNNGIAYLMAVPYALIIGGGIVLFRKQFQNKNLSAQAS